MPSWFVINSKRIFLKIKIRQYKDLDKDYIIKTWLDSNYKNTDACNTIKKSVYYTNHNIIINRIFDDCVKVIACDDTDEDLILGWLVGELKKDCDVLHFLYVRKEFRRKGVGRLLFKNFSTCNSVVTSHHGRISPSIVGDSVTFNPYAFFI